MPQPYRRPSRFKPRAYKRYRAARSIQRSWRARKRGSTSLLTRTALANRRAIKKINKSVETKMIELVTGTPGNNFSGQNIVRISVTSDGTDTTPVPLVQKPFGELAQGVTSAERVGEWVKCKSLTYKIYFESVSGLLAETNHMGVYIVLDRTPNEDVLPNLTGIVPGTPDDGTLLGGNSQLIHLRYQNMATCGNSLRYKVLRHHKVRVQSQLAGTVFPPDATVIGTLKFPYNLRYDTNDAPINQQLCMFYYSDSAAVPHPRVSCHCRFRFKDA